MRPRFRVSRVRAVGAISYIQYRYLCRISCRRTLICTRNRLDGRSAKRILERWRWTSRVATLSCLSGTASFPLLQMISCLSGSCPLPSPVNPAVFASRRSIFHSLTEAYSCRRIFLSKHIPQASCRSIFHMLRQHIRCIVSTHVPQPHAPAPPSTVKLWHIYRVEAHSTASHTMTSRAPTPSCLSGSYPLTSPVNPTVLAGSYLRLIDSCITQLKAQGPSRPARTCNESKEEEERVFASRRRIFHSLTHLLPPARLVIVCEAVECPSTR